MKHPKLITGQIQHLKSETNHVFSSFIELDNFKSNQPDHLSRDVDNWMRSMLDDYLPYENEFISIEVSVLKPLREYLPDIFFKEFMNSKAAHYLDTPVIKEHHDFWPDSHTYPYVRVWWELRGKKAVGFNDNPKTKYKKSFPIMSYNRNDKRRQIA